ncbi:MAG TPA: PHB depolymerase family esterase [Streptosporangiaceae bacterium]|nr:PHB depolymerase family esterase [Streptosporangiaceae bacterium]
MRLMLRPVTVIAGALLLAGCASARDVPDPPVSPAPATPGAHDLRLGARTYRLYVPAGLPAGKAPLVIALHAALGSGGVMELLTRLDRVADRKKFLVAYPDGAPPTARVWNAGDCCNRSAADDVGFIVRLIDELAAARRADPDRVYVTGVSNGAMMAYRLACQRADKVAAIAVVAGSMTYGPCRPARPVPLMIFHGTADTTVPETGGSLPALGMRGTFPSQPEIVRTWSRIDGVSPPVRVSYHEGGVTCRAGDPAMVVYCRVAGGGHTWPGGTPVPLAGPTSTDIDASAAMWDFFAAHRR